MGIVVEVNPEESESHLLHGLPQDNVEELDVVVVRRGDFSHQFDMDDHHDPVIPLALEDNGLVVLIQTCGREQQPLSRKLDVPDTDHIWSDLPSHWRLQGLPRPGVSARVLTIFIQPGPSLPGHDLLQAGVRLPLPVRRDREDGGAGQHLPGWETSDRGDGWRLRCWKGEDI